MSARTIKRYAGLTPLGRAEFDKVTEARKALRKSWGDPGSKSTRRTQARVWSGGKSRQVVVTVYPDGVVGTRLLGTRGEHYTFADDIHRNAAAAAANAKRVAKRKAKGYK